MKGIDRKLIIFTTKKRFNDRNADDMQSGDMDADILKKHYHLGQVSTFIDWTTFGPSYQHPATNSIQPVSREKVIAMLYDELRSQSYAFSFRGPYQGLIINLFNHMQRSNGNDFQHPFMNNAYRNLILSDNSIDSTLSIIKNTIEQFDYNKSQLTKEHFSNVLSKSRLPKYTRWKDFVNGMGITVHDINSTEISIESLTFQGNKYTAVIKYRAQDHFGLDKEDILKAKFNSITFFRIWFVLQRAKHFAQKPFFTNFQATITLTGENNV
ncbi:MULTISPECIES: DUF3289 family protein [unclassified Pantoea]|uniref:DUF3289 family protein n=1 Tax=unclassified Pantoea TaxID=2630326 RepID=UPI0024774E93|nr:MULTISPECIES: DUF3289 family protein [unclassified Pantoea]GME35303.1 DUF3289 family protein [Pantoea sp. QMID3]GME35472.1 DUF3289 family protein [Pantoea sp. QMID1]GME59732.1 DUF3289 family protein [Pantoea sp. QMID4]GME61255.1 DUF3289 family protein [Pantoea sp. QMID2]